MEDSQILIISLIAGITPIMILTIKALYKSKCVEVDLCCGFVKCKRNVIIETELEDQTKRESPKNHQGDSQV